MDSLLSRVPLEIVIQEQEVSVIIEIDPARLVFLVPDVSCRSSGMGNAIFNYVTLAVTEFVALGTSTGQVLTQRCSKHLITL